MAKLPRSDHLPLYSDACKSSSVAANKKFRKKLRPLRIAALFLTFLPEVFQMSKSPETENRWRTRLRSPRIVRRLGSLLWLAAAKWPGRLQSVARLRSLAATAAFGLLLAAGEFVAFLEGQQATLLHPSTGHLDFACACQGTCHEMVFALTNRSRSTVQVASIGSTCRCLRIVLEQPSLSPGETVRALACLDLGQEPDYVGKLGVHVYGRTPTGQIAFRLLATADVTAIPPPIP
jgi:hypothetical protein